MGLIRETVARALVSSGLLRLAINRRRSKVGVVLMYHKVNDNDDPFFPSLPAAVFDGQVGHLQDYYQVTGLDEMVCWLNSEEGGPPRAAITIDDGYPDTHAIVLPILKKRSLPATLFLNTAPVESGETLWMDELSALFAYTEARTFDCPPLEIAASSIDNAAKRLQARADVGRGLKKQDASGFARAFEHLRRTLGGASTDAGRPGMLNWMHVKEIQAGGVRIGAHTHSHKILSRLTDAEARDEVATSIELIRSRLGSTVDCFAYPNGETEDFTQANKRMLADLGIRYSVATIYGFAVPGQDPLELRRMYMGDGSVAMFAGRMYMGDGSVAMFAASIARLRDMISMR
ncbi:MAG: polysaccharide deacetylase family protein [Gammaproteobacteria bacterium]